ncbi:ABC transporter substrate-binding protein [Azospirillum oleiclasticum]|nr:ABC transporter substrate-binding protein [Azospirillum oleiclasticum]
MLPSWAVAGALLLCMTAGTARAQVTLTVTCFAGAGFAEACRTATDEWSRRTGNAVRLLYQPEDTTLVYESARSTLESGSDAVDVFQVDVIWPGALAPRLVDLRPLVPAAEVEAHFPQIVANNTVQGRLVAMPWYTDAGLLYYRKDLLAKHGFAPPRTWAELEAAAKAVLAAEHRAGNRELQGFLWQGRAYEGLTCNALEWIDSFGGGGIVEPDGRVSINNPRAVRALDRAASWLGSITPWAVLFYAEAETRDLFRSGNAVFMRNWPFAWHELNRPDSPVAGKVGVIALPMGEPDGKHSGTLGGWNLAVSSHSRHVAEAVDLVRFMTGREEQKRRAIRWSYSPTIPALYEDPEVLSATPFLRDQLGTLLAAVARPAQRTGRQYTAVSAAFWSAVHATLSGQGDAGRNLGEVERTLERLSNGGKW